MTQTIERTFKHVARHETGTQAPVQTLELGSGSCRDLAMLMIAALRSLRRLLADVEADQSALRRRQAELEAHLLAAPAADWREAAEKARYLLNFFAATLTSPRPTIARRAPKR
jgi:Transglutaminase-like superfamily